MELGKHKYRIQAIAVQQAGEWYGTAKLSTDYLGCTGYYPIGKERLLNHRCIELSGNEESVS